MRKKNSSRGLLICWLPQIAAANARPVVATTAGSGTASSKVKTLGLGVRTPRRHLMRCV